MPWISPTKDTLLKLRPVDSKQLNASESRRRLANDKLAIVAVRKAENNHWQVRLSGDLTIGTTKTRECYLWPAHWDGVGAALLGSEDAARVKAISMSAPTKKSIDGGAVIDIGYKSQTDNKNNPGGSCNVTSTAMCLEYWGIKAEGTEQLEDELYEWLESNGLSRHDPNHLKRVIEQYGAQDNFTTRATIAEIKTALSNGIPVIVHGYFTAFGHIIALIGYSDKGFICHDPYGEWTQDGYLRNNSTNPEMGKAIVYSYGLIERTCLPDGGCWAHFVTRKGHEVPGTQALIKPSGVAQNASAPTAAANATPATPKIPDGCSRVTATQLTLLKSRPIASSELPPEEKNSFDLGEDIVGVASTAACGHVMITLADDSKIKGRNAWYLFSKHVKIETPGGTSPFTPGAKITEADYDRVAKMIGCETRALKTVVMVEAAGGGFLPSGRPKILFEAHWFGDFTGYKYNDSHPSISSKGWNPDLYEGGEKEWDRFEAAAKIDRKFAIGSCSWGLPQIMGAYSWEIPGLGFKDEEDFYTRMCRSESDHLEAMGRFIMLDPRLVSAIKSKNFAKFALAYNGESYQVNAYDQKLQDAYDSLG